MEGKIGKLRTEESIKAGWVAGGNKAMGKAMVAFKEGKEKNGGKGNAVSPASSRGY